MPTPLFKNLKQNGTTIYAFPGAEEDINQTGDNYSMYFSKFALLNLPKVQTALSDEPVIWDFENSFYGASPQPATNFSERIVNSLRSYVANQEVTIRGSKISDTEYFYDNSILQTNAEKVFFKWAKKLNLIQFEKAADGDDYFGELDEFASNKLADDEYFPEVLWKEREVSDDFLSIFYESEETGYTNKLEIEYSGTINYKVGDWIEFTEVENLNFPTIPANANGNEYAEVLAVFDPSGSKGYRVIFDITHIGSSQTEETGYSNLVYNKFVRYIGEIQGNSNVVSGNVAFDQIFASIADNMGETPDILFRTRFDTNYAPDLQFPILPAQYQPEIIGAENFNSPIVQNPTNYPGDQYAQYDNDDALDEYTYLTKTGDSNRRSGEYFGTSGDVNSASYNGDTIDGVQMDFNPDHYVKMNVIGQESTNFDEFNTRQINGEFPTDFTFNAILWYYNVEDVNGNIATNLYGISFLDHPDNEPVDTGSKFPIENKLVATDEQDGTSYQFALNKHTTITTDTPRPTFSNEYINSLFGFNLFNETMRRLVVFNDAASQIVSDNEELQTKVTELSQLIYTQTDIETINTQISQLNDLLLLYTTNQIVDTDSIKVVKDNSSSPPEIQLFVIEGRFNQMTSLDTTTLYDTEGQIAKSVNVPEGKDFFVNINNNDTIAQILPDNQRLIVYLNQDLYYKQTVEFVIDSTETSTENKQLDILITYNNGEGVPVFRTAVQSLDLPVYYNSIDQDQNTAYKWKQIRQDINQLKLNTDGETVGMSASRITGLEKGDTILLDNIFLGDDDLSIDGQYIIDSIGGSTINIDYTQNDNLKSYIETEISDGNLSTGDIISDYNSIGYFKFNKGWKVVITRIDEIDTSTFEDRYLITTSPIY